MEIIFLAFLIILSVSKESLASVSVETLPGTTFKISNPKLTISLFMARLRRV
jgi:hypothetical protein